MAVWGRLSESTRGTITPYLSLNAESVDLSTIVHSPIFDGRRRYSDWVVAWCRQLLATAGAFQTSPHLSPEQRRRAVLLGGTYPCVRYDAGLALSLLPPLIAFLLKAAPVLSDQPQLPVPTPRWTLSIDTVMKSLGTRSVVCLAA